MKKLFLITLASFILLGSNVYASDDFKKGFFYGFNEALIDMYCSFSLRPEILSTKFYINNAGVRVFEFSFNDSMIFLDNLYQKSTSNERQMMTQYIALVKKIQQNGRISNEDGAALLDFRYNFACKSNKIDVKHGFLISKIFVALVIINNQDSPKAMVDYAYEMISSSINPLIMFSGYFFDEDRRDALYNTYKKRNITDLYINTIEIIAEKFELTLKK